MLPARIPVDAVQTRCRAVHFLRDGFREVFNSINWVINAIFKQTGPTVEMFRRHSTPNRNCLGQSEPIICNDENNEAPTKASSSSCLTRANMNKMQPCHPQAYTAESSHPHPMKTTVPREKGHGAIALTRRFTLVLLLIVVLVQLFMSIHTNLPLACVVVEYVDSMSSPSVARKDVASPPSKKHRKLNVLYGLSGNIPEFITEFGVSLKSVLLNAPIDADMDVHLIVDSSAYQAVVKLLRSHGIKGSIWRNQIQIIFYIVSESKKFHYENVVLDALPVKNVTTGKRVGPGGLFRLFSYEILPADTAPVLYLDNDVVIFANLNEINSIIDDQYVYQVGVGNDVCSGLMIINLQRFQEFWGYLRQVSPHRIPTNSGRVGDQLMLHRVKELLRNRNLTLIGDLPKEWHVHLAHGYRRKAHLLRVKRPRIGMMHFNGKRDNDELWWGGGIWRYCDEGDCKNDTLMQQDFRETWNLAEYYVHQPWSMAKYLGMTLAGETGKALKISTRCAENEADCKT